jgi:hypothetical protein
MVLEVLGADRRMGRTVRVSNIAKKIGALFFKIVIVTNAPKFPDVNSTHTMRLRTAYVIIDVLLFYDYNDNFYILRSFDHGWI